MAIDQANLFQNVPDERIEVNTYSLDHDYITTTEAGRLVVLFCRRVLPGEKWRVAMDAFLRTQPLQNPIFGKMDFYAHAFFVRNGSISDSHNDYVRACQDGRTEIQPDLLNFTINNLGTDAKVSYGMADFAELSDYLDPEYFEAYKRPFFSHGSLSDDLGLGSVDRNELSSGNKKIRPFSYSLIPFKCYQAIFSEYYADANVMTFDDMDTIEWEQWLKPLWKVQLDPNTQYCDAKDYNGRTHNPVATDYDPQVIIRNLFARRYRCYAKDYFTSCLDEPQRGPDVLIPVDAQIAIQNKTPDGEPHTFISPSSQTSFLGNTNGDTTLYAGMAPDNKFEEEYAVNIYNADCLKAQISSLSSTITDLRTAIALQEFYESSARYGNRYKEFVYGHFGSMIPDDQLVRPWYLGGMKLPIQISEVLQTAPDAEGEGVGNMYGKGLSSGDAYLFDREFSDYGTIMIIGSIRPRNYYKNNIKREFTITDRMDEFYRKLQAVGEQPVYRYELQGFMNDSEDALNKAFDTFGYQMRYSEYKLHCDEIHGDFKGNLADWTLARDFGETTVNLNDDFLTVKPSSVNHIFQYTGDDADHFLLQCHFNIERETPMEVYSIPRIN